MKTNWDKWKEEVKPETIGHMLSNINGERGSCEYCPKGCQHLCEEYKKEVQKWMDGEPFDKEKRDIADDCETMFVHWANAKAEGTTPRRMTEKELWKRMASMKQSELYDAFGIANGASKKEDK